MHFLAILASFFSSEIFIKASVDSVVNRNQSSGVVMISLNINNATQDTIIFSTIQKTGKEAFEFSSCNEPGRCSYVDTIDIIFKMRNDIIIRSIPVGISTLLSPGSGVRIGAFAIPPTRRGLYSVYVAARMSGNAVTSTIYEGKHGGYKNFGLSELINDSLAAGKLRVK